MNKSNFKLELNVAGLLRLIIIRICPQLAAQVRNRELHFIISDGLVSFCTGSFRALGWVQTLITFLIFNFQRPCRHFLVTKTRRPRYYHITVALVFNFSSWYPEQLPPVFCKLGHQPNVSDGSLLSREATKLLVTLLSFSWVWDLIILISAKKMPHR